MDLLGRYKNVMSEKDPLNIYLDSQIATRIFNKRKNRKYPFIETPITKYCSSCWHPINLLVGYTHWSSHEEECFYIEANLVDIPRPTLKNKIASSDNHKCPVCKGRWACIFPNPSKQHLKHTVCNDCGANYDK